MQGLKNLTELFVSWIKTVFSLGIEPDYIILVCVAAAAILLTASAMLAGQIAESRGHAPHLHIWLGFFLPFAYPALITKSLKSVIGENAPKSKAETVEKPKIALKKTGIAFKEPEPEQTAETPEKNPQNQTETQTCTTELLLAPGTVCTKDIARKIAVRADGTAAGTFVFNLADNSSVNVFRITDASTHCM